MFAGRKEIVEKGEIFKKEHMLSSSINTADKNENFGFFCLHFSVSEGSKSLSLKVLNKKRKACSVGVRTVEMPNGAKAGKDFGEIDVVLSFNKGQEFNFVEVPIYDDDDWEPDQDFMVELYDIDTSSLLKGMDVRTRVTIIDDDKPGFLSFKEKRGNLRTVGADGECKVVVLRTNGSDGKISVKYKTFEISEAAQHMAVAGKDFVPVEGTLEFEHNEVEKEIIVPIIVRKEGEENQERDEIFGVKLYDPQPSIVKISKKDTVIVEIVTDAQKKKQADSLQQLLDRINREERITWKQQFINACMLHPTKNEDGAIEDISGTDAVLHFLSIGWKFLFALCPPPHYAGGWACFIVAISFIGLVTFVVGEIAAVMGCVMGVKPSVTAITFVAIGTSLPDTFASMTAARESRYADSAVGNITGSNSVNVFLGLGLPWVIAVIYSQ